MRKVLKTKTNVIGEPLQVLGFKEGNAEFNHGNLNKIFKKAGNRKIAIISINGPLRTGKSYVLSNFIRFLGNEGRETNGVSWFHNSDGGQDRFRWKGGSERTTLGIDMWSEPLATKVGDEHIALLFMDTQGSFDQETTMSQNSVVFAVSAMLSSVFIYNCNKSLPESDFQFLHFFTTFSQQVNESERCLADKLVFLIRDFQDTIDYAFGYYSPFESAQGVRVDTKNYFLNKVMNNSKQNDEVQATHKGIMKAFEEVGCFLMPEPAKQLKQRDDESNMDEEFLEYLDIFLRKMLSEDQLTLKRVSGKYVTAESFLTFVQRWAQCIDGERMPSVSTICEMTLIAQLEVASIEARKFYTSALKQLLTTSGAYTVSQSQQDSKHVQLVEEALEIFSKHCKSCPGQRDAKTRLKEELMRIYSDMRTTDALQRLSAQHAELINLDEVSRQYADCIIEANNILRSLVTDRNCVILFANRTDLEIQVETTCMNSGMIRDSFSKIQGYQCFNITAVKKYGVYGVEGMFKLFLPALNKTVGFMFAVPMLMKNRFALAKGGCITEGGDARRHFWTLYRGKECDSRGKPTGSRRALSAIYEEVARKRVQRGCSETGSVKLSPSVIMKVTMRSAYKAMFVVEFNKIHAGHHDHGLEEGDDASSIISSDEEEEEDVTLEEMKLDDECTGEVVKEDDASVKYRAPKPPSPSHPKPRGKLNVSWPPKKSDD